MRTLRTLVVALALSILAGTASAEPTKIRVGWIFAPASLGPLLFAHPELTKHLNKTYTYEPVHFASTAVELTALASGDIDIADLSFSAIGSAIEGAHLEDLRIIGDEIQEGVHGYRSDSGFHVLKDSPIQKIEDLKGKVIAVLTLGSATDMQVRLMLRRHGLEPNRDYTEIEAQFPNMKDLLLTHKADMVASAAPYSYDPELRAASRILFTDVDAFGPIQLTSWQSRTPFIEKNRAALVDFLEDTIRSIRWWIDPNNHSEAVKLVADFNKQKPENIDWIFTKHDLYRDPDWLPNLDALQSNLESEREIGLLKAHIDIKKYADLSLVKEAAARVKR